MLDLFEGVLTIWSKCESAMIRFLDNIVVTPLSTGKLCVENGIQFASVFFKECCNYHAIEHSKSTQIPIETSIILSLVFDSFKCPIHAQPQNIGAGISVSRSGHKLISVSREINSAIYEFA